MNDDDIPSELEALERSENGRQWWAAWLLSVLLLGLGQVYNGQLRKGILLFGLTLLLASLGVFAAMHLPLDPPLNALLAWAVPLGVIGFGWIDAIRQARRQRHSYQVKRYNRWYVYLGLAATAYFAVFP